jgi:hypothetical protein
VTTTSLPPTCGNDTLDPGEDCDPPGAFTCAVASPEGSFVACSGECRCPTAEIPCGDATAPECDGACPPGGYCTQGVPPTGTCFCRFEPCGSFSTECLGECPPGTTCTGTPGDCACTPTDVACGGSLLAPECDGLCPPFQYCLDTGAGCECFDIGCGGALQSAPDCVGECGPGGLCVNAEDGCICAEP